MPRRSTNPEGKANIYMVCTSESRLTVTQVAPSVPSSLALVIRGSVLILDSQLMMPTLLSKYNR